MMYEYSAEILRVIDGDTVHVRLDLGCDVGIDLTLRLAEINAPEMSTEEGVLAAEFLRNLIQDETVTVKTFKDKKEKYGRYLATIYLGEQSVNEIMVTEGHAVPYMARKTNG
jgi:micrococcal nuclease